ncbi:MAG: GTPase ObgE [Firmicutes bacterium]|nr:GTPase ObgE [Bacillota bacterium]
MFVDEIILKVVAGTGGDGCTSFRREKCVPMGGPDGGNGGHGADIIFTVDKGLKTLIDLRYMKIIKGNKGVNGKGSNKYGSNAENVIIKVPLGTTITDLDTGLVIADLVREEQSVIIAKGGRGGKGNKSFATHDNPAPKFSEKGEPGEIRLIKCELKMLADVGLVGLPSVGKSTLLSQISASKPKIAAYHFTTLSPNLGVVKLQDHRTFVMADLPGLIEGASEGVGLGDKFLRHAMRTRILCHIIDMSGIEGRNPVEDYQVIRNELDKYSDKLSNKIEIIVANKMDIEGFDENLEEFKKVYPDKLVFSISAMNNTGINELLEFVADKLDEVNSEHLYNENEFESHMVFKFKEEKPYTIEKDGDVWVIKGEEIEKLFNMTRFNEDEAVLRFARKLRGMGVEAELERLGAKRGDEVQILEYIFEFKE